MDKLRFHVVHVSSEDDEYPASELDTHNPQTKGWQSQRFCEYPQEIGVRLDNGMARINQVQILSHQSKIAKKVELFVGTGADYFGAKFKRLGYLSLDENSRSNYNARELKSVYIDDVGNFLKFVVHQHHQNTLNLHGQVGIVAINLLGSLDAGGPGGAGAGGAVARGVKGAAAGAAGRAGGGVAVANPLNDLSIDMGLDPGTAEKLRKIAEAKRRAVEVEDYMTAKQIKMVESEMMKLGSKLTQLETSKRRAVADEDYDRAKELKDAMDGLRREIEDKIRSINIPGVSNDDRQHHHHDHGGGGRGGGGQRQAPPREQPPPQTHATPNKLSNSGGGGGGGSGSRKPIVNVDDQVVGGGTGVYNVQDYSGGGRGSHGKVAVHEEDMDMESPRSKQRGGGNDQYGYNDNGGDYYDEDGGDEPAGFDTRPIRPKKRDIYDDLDPEVDGEAAYKQQMDNEGDGSQFPAGQHPFEGLENKLDLPQPEQFNAKAREVTDLSKVIDLIGEYRARALFSTKCIPLRESSLIKIRRMLDSGEFAQSAGGHLVAIPALMSIVRVGIDDKIAQVYLAAIHLLELVLTMMKRENIPKSEAAHMIDPLVAILIERLNDGQTKIRDAAMKTLKFIITTTAVGAPVIATQCLRPMPPKQKAAWRPLCNRLQLLHDIIKNNGMSTKSGVSVDGVLNFCKSTESFTHSNGEVRDITKAACVAMAKVVGANVVLPQLEPFLRKQQFDDYTAACGGGGGDDARGGSPNNGKGGAPTSARGGAGSSGGANHSSGGNTHRSPNRKGKGGDKGGEDDAEGPPSFTTCMFCGTHDATWNEDALDLHYWKSCPMLTQCPGCGQVTEIAGLPIHLQDECEQREHYAFDEVTGLSVRKDEMAAWKKKETYAAPPENCVYCPLCVASVEDSDDAWLKHLSQVCPLNTRIAAGGRKSRPSSSAAAAAGSQSRPKSGAGGGSRPASGAAGARPASGKVESKVADEEEEYEDDTLQP